MKEIQYIFIFVSKQIALQRHNYVNKLGHNPRSQSVQVYAIQGLSLDLAEVRKITAERHFRDKSSLARSD